MMLVLLLAVLTLALLYALAMVDRLRHKQRELEEIIRSLGQDLKAANLRILEKKYAKGSNRLELKIERITKLVESLDDSWRGSKNLDPTVLSFLLQEVRST